MKQNVITFDLGNMPSDSPDVAHFYLSKKYYNSPGISIGEHTYGLFCADIKHHKGRINIGSYCSIANGTKLVIHPEHNTKWVSKYPFHRLPSTWKNAHTLDNDIGTPVRGDINIGNDVWIGSDVTILGGATVGHGAVIGANSVVAGKVPPYSIVVGNPAKIIRFQFTDVQIEKLLEISWWNWPEEKVQEHVTGLCSDNIDAFIEQFYVQ